MPYRFRKEPIEPVRASSDACFRPMTELLPWEAPAVLDIDIATGTLGGCTRFSTESTYTFNCYAAPSS